jgi:hypothetical protein
LGKGLIIDQATRFKCVYQLLRLISFKGKQVRITQAISEQTTKLALA